MTKKFFTTITPFSKALALIMLVIFPIVGFWLGIKYDESKNNNFSIWKTYTDQRGFSFQYPSDKVTIVKENGGYIFNIINDKNQMTILGSDEFEYLRSFKNLNDFINNNCLDKKGNFYFCTKPIPGPIQGSLQYDIVNSDSNETRTIFQHNGIFYNIHIIDFDRNAFDYKTHQYINSNKTIDLSVKQIYNQILSTFKFTN